MYCRKGLVFLSANSASGEMVEWSKTSGLGPDLRKGARVRTPLSSNFCQLSVRLRLWRQQEAIS